MLYQKKRRKLNLFQSPSKQNEDSTRNSDRLPSSDKPTDTKTNNRKSFTKLFTKRTFNKNSSDKNSSLQKPIHSSTQSKLQNLLVYSKTSDKKFEEHTSSDEHFATEKNLRKQKLNSLSNTNSACFLQQNAEQCINSNRKKFKLYCQVKKKKQTDKKSEDEKQTDRFAASSTASESWLKNSIFSKNSQKHESVFTHKDKSLKRKIDLNEKIKLIKSKEKQKNSIKQSQNSTLKIIDFQPQARQKFIQSSDQVLKKCKKTLEKKHSTLNIKRSVVLSKFNSEKQVESKIGIEISENQNTKFSKEPTEPEAQSPYQNKTVYTTIQNKILPQDSQIIEESVKKLSQIKEQKNDDTISRSIKTNFRNSIDQSKSKDTEQASMHLSINSICKDRRTSFGCVLEITELRESSGLKKEIESSLSEIEKSRQKIDIKKFEGLKKIAELGSQISDVEYSMTTIQKIEFHIELINTLSNFVYKSTELEYLMEDWDELNFLIYKKFYLERMKVLNFLKKYPIKNPFCIKRGSIETKQILKALRENEVEIKRIKSLLEAQNLVIKKNLEVFYNQFSKQQHGEKINLLEYDNFSHWIYKELWDEIQLFSYSQSHNQLELEDRICKSLQAGFLISELNGNYVTPFEDAQIASRHNQQKVYIDDNLKVFERYVLNKKK